MRRLSDLRLALLFCTIAAAQQGPPVSIRVVEGDGAINSIRLRRARDPVVRVVDRAGEPISGAAVTFLLPSTGPSGTFGAFGLSMTMQTDDRGIAAGRGLRPNGIPGQFRIRVTTSWRGTPAAATLLQTNTGPAVSSGRTKKVAIIGIIAAAVAGGAIFAAGGGSSTPSSGGPAGVVQGGGSIAPGTPSLGPPR